MQPNAQLNRAPDLELSPSEGANKKRRGFVYRDRTGRPNTLATVSRGWRGGARTSTAANKYITGVPLEGGGGGRDMRERDREERERRNDERAKYMRRVRGRGDERVRGREE